MYHWGTDEKIRVRGCPSCPYNIKVGRCEVGLRKFPKITAVRRWYSSFGWNFRHNTTEWTFKNVVLAFQNVLTFENSLWWRLLVNDQKMGSQKLGAYEVRYKWKIQNSITSVKQQLQYMVAWLLLISGKNQINIGYLLVISSYQIQNKLYSGI